MIEDNQVLARKKRQAEFDPERDPAMEDAKSAWEELLETMVEGGKKFMKKIVQSFDKKPEQAEAGY